MNHNTTLTELQEYIKTFDHNPENPTAYFMKLIEEVGELSEALRKNVRMDAIGSIKGTVEEELCDVMYYVAALANVYDINLNESFKVKDELNKVKWNR